MTGANGVTVQEHVAEALVAGLVLCARGCGSTLSRNSATVKSLALRPETRKIVPRCATKARGQDGWAPADVTKATKDVAVTKKKPFGRCGTVGHSAVKLVDQGSRDASVCA